MATCRSIVTGGLQLLGVYAGGEDPSDVDVNTGLSALQSTFNGWVNSGMFGRLTDKYVTANYTAKEGERITAATGVTVTLPTTITCWSTTRTPRDLSCIEVKDDSGLKVYIYDRTGWVQINNLSLDAECPLSTRGERGLHGVIAFETAGDFNMPVQPNVARLSSQFRAMLSMKLGSTQDPTPVEYF
jgi:hypothetical protein